MDKAQASTIANKILYDIFHTRTNFSIDEIETRFASDIPTPTQVQCVLSKQKTWLFHKHPKPAKQDKIAALFKKDEWMRPQRPIQSIKDIFTYWNDINYYVAEKTINSKDTCCSDGVYNSITVFKSSSIYDSSNIFLSYKIINSKYLIASRDSMGCSNGLRIKDSLYSSNSFEISWSSKISNSFFIHDSYDLYECMFCSHIRSKKYCIANMQYSKEEYFRIKAIVTKWILANFSSI